jgi:hypothetical protein
MHGPVNYLSGNSLKASILKRARPPAVSPARMMVSRSLIGRAGRRSSMPIGKRARKLFSQPQFHCGATRLDARLSERVESLLGKLAVAGNRRAGTCRTHRTWLDRSDHCRGAHERSRSLAFARPVDDRTTRAGRGDSSKPGGRLYLHQEAFGMLAVNATIRHQLEPWAARLREDQPHLLAARRARQFGHSEIRTGRSRSGDWLHRGPTHWRKHNATNMMILSASARIWTEPPRIILMVPIGSKSGRRRELQATWPTKTSPFSNSSPAAFSAVPRGKPTQPLGIQLGRVLEIAESSLDKFTYENKIAERFDGQKELELIVPTPSVIPASEIENDEFLQAVAKLARRDEDDKDQLRGPCPVRCPTLSFCRDLLARWAGDE